MHQSFNRIEADKMDYTHINRTKHIDSISKIAKIINLIEGSWICKTNKIIQTN